MDAATLKLAKNYTNEQVVQKATNSPVEEISFDGGIYSVGNNVVNGQVSDVAVKGQTWTNRAGVGDTSPQTVSNLDITKTYLLINDAGANVTIDTVDTPTPVKLTGDTEFDFVWASGKIALYELSAEETALDASVLGQKYRYVNGTKSTNSVRVRSVNEDETKESIVNVNLPEPLRSLPNGVKDEFNVTSGIKTQRVGNKTNVASGTVINYTDMATGGQFVAYAVDGSSQIGVKGDTLTITAVTLIYQLAQPIITKLPAQPPLQIYENGTVYVEPIGDASESTLPSVEMTIPTGTSNKFGVATHNYGGAAADWELTNSESKCFLLAVSSAGGSANIIAPDAPGAMYAISNASGHTITIKISGGNGVKVTNAKTVLVIHNGTDYVALTAEL